MFVIVSSPGRLLGCGIKNGTLQAFVPLQIGERPGTKVAFDEA
jgi:hypothetical protein